MSKQSRYLVLKVKGLGFVRTWYGAPKCVPPDLTRIYQLLLHMVTMKGTIPVRVVLRIGYTSRIIGETVKRGYVELCFVPKKASKEVMNRITEIIGKPPREMLV